MLSDIEIAKQSEVKDIREIAQKINISPKYLETYGNDKAKVSLSIFDELGDNEDGKLILVSAITPTPLGEGKSTTSIGLVDALNKLNKSNWMFKRTFTWSSLWN